MLEDGKVLDSFWERFLGAVNQDLGVPQALAVVHEMIKSDLSEADKGTMLLKMDQVLGLKLDEYIGKPLEIPQEVQKLVEEREEARKNKDFKKSDQLRGKLKKLGFEIEDTPSGSKIRHRQG